jgi:hypothetical protein
MFSYVLPEQRIPKDHPLRALVDEVLADMSREFDRLYATTGRPSTKAGPSLPGIVWSSAAGPQPPRRITVTVCGVVRTCLRVYPLDLAEGRPRVALRV